MAKSGASTGGSGSSSGLAHPSFHGVSVAEKGAYYEWVGANRRRVSEGACPSLEAVFVLLADVCSRVNWRSEDGQLLLRTESSGFLACEENRGKM